MDSASRNDYSWSVGPLIRTPMARNGVPASRDDSISPTRVPQRV